jgi:endonuclease/exonuclease/phosphatase family metal-dependent hydrolase
MIPFLRRKILKHQLLLVLLFTAYVQGQSKDIRIATWNIEHLGSGGRGFPEISPAFGFRSSGDLIAIANFIKDTLAVDILAVQEIAVTHAAGSTAKSHEMDLITAALGSQWQYVLANPDAQIHSPDMQNAFIYNSENVSLEAFFIMPVPDYQVGAKPLFDRPPLVVFFKGRHPALTNPGFVMVNVHLASGQDNDENHLAAMVIIEQNITRFLGANGLSTRERDRIILGDFNDNPFATNANGMKIHIPTLYQYMALKNYRHMVDSTFVSTRMSQNFNSIIDHILVSKGLWDNLKTQKAGMYLPADTSASGLKEWRRVYSDHFPLFLDIRLK